jgi:hypothetical protein
MGQISGGDMKSLLFRVSVLLCIFTTSCSSGGNSNNTTANQTPAQSIAALEASGALPKLDRSTSVAGPDTNANGIRDDVDAWIASQNAAAPQKAALNQHAKALQTTLTTDLTNANAVTQASLATARSIKCLFKQYTGVSARQMASDLKKITVNTKERYTADMSFAAKLNGSVITFPQGDTCE